MKMCKSLFTVALVTLAMSAAPLTAHAETFGRTASGHTFSDDWEVSDDLVLQGQKIGECVYGFDARAILSDQDYGKCYIVDHKAKTSVAPGGYIAVESDWSYPSTWTVKVSCKHTSSSVSYYFQSYGNI